MSLALAAAIAIAGAVGAALRYVVGERLARGTWLVNVTGSLALGALVGTATWLEMGEATMLVVGGGLLGAYTTFSTWMIETLEMIERGRWRAAIGNLAWPVAAGLAAAAAGLGLARVVLGH